MPAGACVAVEIAQQRQERVVHVLVALAEAVVLDPPDDYALLLMRNCGERVRDGQFRSA